MQSTIARNLITCATAFLAAAGAFANRMETHVGDTITCHIGEPMEKQAGICWVDVDWVDVDSNDPDGEYGDPEISVSGMPDWMKWYGQNVPKDASLKEWRIYDGDNLTETHWYPEEGELFNPVVGTPNREGTWIVKISARWPDSHVESRNIEIRVYAAKGREYAAYYDETLGDTSEAWCMTHYPVVCAEVGKPLLNPHNGQEFVDVDFIDLDSREWARPSNAGDETISVSGLPGWLSWDKNRSVKRSSRGGGGDIPTNDIWWYDPSGASYHPLSGTPTQTGVWTVSITSSWRNGHSETVKVKIVVVPSTMPRVYLTFDPNDGSCPVESKGVRAWEAVGELPVPVRDGYAFTGWFTAREGGALVTANTTMVPYNVALYAHWEPPVAGSCLEKAIAFPFGPSVASYPVALAREWLEKEGRYDDASGVLYCKSTVARGKVYTIALPVGQEFEVSCADAGAVVSYAAYGSLRYCRVDARGLDSGTAEIALALYGVAGAKTTVYAVEGDLVPAAAAWEDPGVGGLPGSCPGKASALGFGPSVAARTVRLVREWDEDGERYLDGGVHYLGAAAPADGRLTVAVPAAQAEGCEVSCAGAAVPREDFGGLAFWIFEAQAGDEVLVRLSGARGADAAVYAYGGDFLAKRLLFDPNGGTCPVASKEVRAGAPVGELPTPGLALNVFQGWFTAREGGARVTAATAMVNYDVTLYARWEAVAFGSCPEKAIAFPFGPSVAVYPVTLAKEWLEKEGRYDDASGVLYCKSSVARGKVYTIALPVGQDYEVACGDAGAIVEYAAFGALRYCRVDAQGLVSGTAEIALALYGGAGVRTTVYVVEGDLVPADADYEAPPAGSCPGRATGLEFGAAAQARAVRLVREWDEDGERYLDGGVHYFRAVAPASGRLTVAVPAAAADGCEVSSSRSGSSTRRRATRSLSCSPACAARTRPSTPSAGTSSRRSSSSTRTVGRAPWRRRTCAPEARWAIFPYRTTAPGISSSAGSRRARAVRA